MILSTHRRMTVIDGMNAVWMMHAGRLGVPGWWDPNNEGLCIWSAYQPKGAASFAASTFDLSGMGNHLLGMGAVPDWDAVNGWKFTAENLDKFATTFLPQNDQSQSTIYQFSNATGSGAAFGKSQGTNRYYMTRQFGGKVYYYNGGFASVAPVLAAGNLCVAGNQGYRGGAPDGGLISGWGLEASGTGMAIGCAATAIGYTAYWSGYIQALAIYDCTLTAPQVAAVAAAMAAL